MAVPKPTLSTVAASAVLALCGSLLGVVVAGPAAAADTAPTPQPAATVPATLAPATGGPANATLADPARPGAPAAAPVAQNLALSSYDPGTGSAVLAPAANTPSIAASPAGPAGDAVKPGQLIDSPPTAAAPHGALVAVTGVRQAADGTVAVSTRPATLPELLGSTSAALHTAIDPGSFHVEPQLKGIQVTSDLGPVSGHGSISGGIGLKADATVPLPNGSTATLAGSVELDPSVDFSYQGATGLIDPQQARIGFALGAHADWHVSGTFTGGVPIRIPIATYSASPVVMVGALPVVINLAFTLSADISADGTVTLDAEQSYDGSWGVHSDYVKGPGWTTTTDPGTSTVSPLKLSLSGAASVKAGLLAEGSIALYDTVGVKASIEPYLRVAADGTVVLDPGNTAPIDHGTVTLYGGIAIDGALMARLVILGTPVLEKDLPFLAFRREWQLTSLTTGQAPAHAATWTPLVADAGDDNRSAYLTARADWDSGAHKASCPDGGRLVGLSHGGDRGLCTDAAKADLWAADRAFTVVHDETNVTADWAYGYTKAQCPTGSFATGFSRNGRSLGVLCAKAAGPLSTVTRTVWFDKGDNRPAPTGGDFAYGWAKGQCADDEYVAGVAYSQPWYELWASRPYAMLCAKLV
ncbi:hypothetical protein GCM10010441_42360 [Kitasatospora paracochleata]|uniref:Uncharacterized protein n=1 Tax=Kitasatospora paracochleata TaxID=58354 RepID=A0ABT1J2L2_9ACTN|nr:hypothetical protein [Kitasatospora paracochleata]MCP2310976.1 hypothetical protein [Kitasatospora paracochleata]